ncbi:hypothetical protein CQZ93_15625 [Ochrobactrum vermis]|nr:hypothetical protein CQZ93_15625 [Ochrobactrum vermis]
MVPARSSRHGISCSRHLSRSQAEIPLIPPVQISRASSETRHIEISVFRVKETGSPIKGMHRHCRQFQKRDT